MGSFRETVTLAENVGGLPRLIAPHGARRGKGLFCFFVPDPPRGRPSGGGGTQSQNAHFIQPEQLDRAVHESLCPGMYAE